MADEKTQAPAQVSGFELLKVQPAITLYKVGKRWALLNHDTAPGIYGDQTVPVATQAQLKEVYDSRPEYKALVKPPKGYKAPWEK